MAAKLRKVYLFPIAVSTLLSSAVPGVAQNSLQIFGSTHDRASVNGTTNATPVTFNSATVNLSCASGGPISAVLSSSPDGKGNVLVDNFIRVTVTAGTTKTGPTNVCRGGTADQTSGGPQNNCFSSTYEGTATSTLLGQNVNPFVAADGVPAIDISSLFSPATQQATIDLVDTGTVLANASLYLVTSCTLGGVTGPATVTGNPISGNPTPDQLKQDFDFNTAPGQTVGFSYDISTSQSNGTLAITDATIPSTKDMPLDPALWQPQYAKGTSFATSSCMVHRGELLNGVSACKLYTLTCQVGTGATSAGALCPVSQLRDEVFSDQFTGPKFLLPNIAGPNGKTYHEGVGLLMMSEGWTGGTCIFDAASGLQTQDCPQNLLTSFSSPGSAPVLIASLSPFLQPHALFAGAFFDLSLDDSMDINGTGTHPNSTFVSVYGVPEDLTTVKVVGHRHHGWVNSHTVKLEMESEPPVLPNTVPNYQNFVASPIQSITYGLAPVGTVLSTKFAIPGDTVLTNPNGCPTAGTATPPPAKEFAPPTQVLTGVADGQYLLHYFAQDCAGTEELKFASIGNGGWATSFYTVPVNVDTVPPVVVSGPTLSPAPGTVDGVPNAYRKGQKVTATFRCKDQTSGVVECGEKSFSAGTLDTGALSRMIDTSDPGKHTFTVEVEDAAGNEGTPVSVTYRVVGGHED
jgi:hypothetical protein